MKMHSLRYVAEILCYCLFIVNINKCNAEVSCSTGEYVEVLAGSFTSEIAQKCAVATVYTNPGDPTIYEYTYQDHLKYCQKICTFGADVEFEAYTVYVHEFWKTSLEEIEELGGWTLLENSQISAWLQSKSTQSTTSTSLLISEKEWLELFPRGYYPGYNAYDNLLSFTGSYISDMNTDPQYWQIFYGKTQINPYPNTDCRGFYVIREEIKNTLKYGQFARDCFLCTQDLIYPYKIWNNDVTLYKKTTTELISTCATCPVGKYSPNTPTLGHVACTTCEYGKYASESGSSVCIDCAEYEQSNLDWSGCEACSINEVYVVESANQKCLECPANSAPHHQTTVLVSCAGGCACPDESIANSGEIDNYYWTPDDGRECVWLLQQTLNSGAIINLNIMSLEFYHMSPVSRLRIRICKTYECDKIQNNFIELAVLQSLSSSVTYVTTSTHPVMQIVYEKDTLYYVQAAGFLATWDISTQISTFCSCTLGFETNQDSDSLLKECTRCAENYYSTYNVPICRECDENSFMSIDRHNNILACFDSERTVSSSTKLKSYDEIVNTCATCAWCEPGKHRPAESEVCINCFDAENSTTYALTSDSSVTHGGCYPYALCAAETTDCDVDPSGDSCSQPTFAEWEAKISGFDWNNCPSTDVRPHPRVPLCPPGSRVRELIFEGKTAVCTQCEPGKYNDVWTELESCKLCGINSFQDLYRQSSCKTCEIGKYQPADGESACLPCSFGYYLNVASGACTPCAENTYQDVEGKTACENCESGKYQPETGQSACLPCEVGMYLESNGICASCPGGKYSNDIGDGIDTCLTCEENTYSLERASICTSCYQKVRYMDTTGFASREYISDSGSDSSDDCRCGAGYFKDSIKYAFGGSDGDDLQSWMDSDVPLCVPCAPGKYASEKTVGTTCTQCVDGKYSMMGGNDPAKIELHCLTCPANSHSSAEIWSYKIKNYWQADVYYLPTLISSDDELLQDNTLVTHGHCRCNIGYENILGNSQSQPLLTNDFASQYLVTDLICDVYDSAFSHTNDFNNFYWPMLGCRLCPAGKYNNNENAWNLDADYDSGNGQSRCAANSLHKSGRVMHRTNIGICLNCPAGKYSSEGASECWPCQSPKFAPNDGMTSCVTGNTGTYFSLRSVYDPVVGNYENCEAGMFTPDANSYCERCAAGKFSDDATGSVSVCSSCTAGTFSVEKSSLCSNCIDELLIYDSKTFVTLNTHLLSPIESTSSSMCVCTHGYREFDSAAGSGCVACQPGTYNEKFSYYQEVTSCLFCAAGKYSYTIAVTPAFTSNACQTCPANSHTSWFRHVFEWELTAGRFPSAQQIFYPEYMGNLQALQNAQLSDTWAQTNDISTFSLEALRENSFMTNVHCRCDPGFQNQVSQWIEDSEGQAYVIAEDRLSHCQPFDDTLSNFDYDQILPWDWQNHYDNGNLHFGDQAPAAFYSMLACEECSLGKFNDNKREWNLNPKYSNCREANNAQHWFLHTPNIAFCIPCEAGKYADSAIGATSCLQCSAGTFSIAGQTVCNACHAGKYYDNTQTIDYTTGTFENGFGICMDCIADYYQDNTGQSACKLCPDNSNTDGQTGSVTCICIEGSELLYDQCQVCISGKYALRQHPFGCEVCSAGKYRSNDGIGIDLSGCITCPSNSATYEYDENNLPAAWQNWMEPQNLYEMITLCKCNSGYSRNYNKDFDTDPCAECGAGKYYNRDEPHWTARESDLQTWLCVDCENGKYTTEDAMSACEVCAPHSSTNGASGQVSCQCEAGFTKKLTGECDLCAAGKSKNYWGDDACDDCATGTVSSTNRQNCEQCPNYETTDTSNPPQCKCREGYTRSGGVDSACVECVSGKYKNFVSDDACTNCEAGRKITGQVAAVNEDASCAKCETGKFSGDTPPTEYSCNDCADFSTTLQVKSTSESDCLCNAGYYYSLLSGNPNLCHVCEAGEFKETISNTDSCNDCALGTYSYEAATQCTSCVPGTYSITNKAQSVEFCTACVGGKYSLQVAANSAATCLPCVAGKFSFSASSQCTDCVAGKYSTSIEGDSDLVCIACDAGKFNEDAGSSTAEACLNCEAGKFYALSGANSALWCEFCTAGYWSSLGSVLCTPCANGMTSLSPFDSIGTCVCGIGYYMLDGNCEQCPTASSTSDVDKQSSDDCLCNAGYAQAEDSSCKLCGSGEIKVNVGNNDCLQCPDHHKATSDRLECEPCNANEYLLVSVTVNEELHICNNCPAYSASLEGSVNVQACKCNAGYSGEDGGVCLACAAGTYKSIIGSSECLSCGSNALSVSNQRTSQSSCSCNAGYTYQDQNCVACEVGKYKENAGTEICTTCSNGGVTPLASVSSLDCCPDGEAGVEASCRCRIGFELVTEDGVSLCKPCQVNFYQELDFVATLCRECLVHYSTNGSTGASSCATCQHGSEEIYTNYTSFIDNITKVDTEKTCACSAGYGTNNVLTACQKCSSFQIQPQIGFFTCSACPNNMISKDGKTCQCPQNHEAFESIPGISDSFLYSVSDVVLSLPKLCVQCRENEVSVAGGQCRCIPGFSRQPALDETQQLQIITNADFDDMAQFNLTRSDRAVCQPQQSSQCIASRRLPPFALKISSKTSFHAHASSTESSSLKNGFGNTETSFARTVGACKMGLLHEIDDADNETFADSYLHEQSLQYCGQNTTHVECVVLVQNDKPFQTIRTFKKHARISPKQDLTSRPKRLCNACDSQQLNGVLSRILQADEYNMPNKMNKNQFSDTTKKQLSIGKPFALPATKMISSRLRKMMCAANDNCEIFDKVLNITQENEAETNINPIINLLKQNRVEEAEISTKTRLEYHKADDALWNRDWVYCSHSNHSKRTDLKQCHGSITKEVWKNPKTRLPACAAVIKEKPEQFDAPILFCLLNADTEKLCQQIPVWREEIRAILCKASGLCPDTDFFYSPTAFNLRNQEFVGTSVQKFYERYVPDNCAVSLNEPTVVNAEILAQKEFNAEALKHCSANNLQSFISAVQSARLVKRYLLLSYYWFTQMVSKAIQLFIASFIDFTTSAIVAAGGEDGFVGATNTLESAIQQLTIAIVAFINSLGTFVENLKEPMLKLLFSKGLGKQFQNIIEAICIALKTIYNYFLKPVMCPLIKLILNLAKILMSILKEIINVIGWIPGAGGAASNLKDVVSTIQTIIDQIIQFATNFCAGWTQNCSFDDETVGQEEMSTTITATRCWSFYQTFYGDSSTLSCSKADTCRKSRLSGELLMCGECPNIQNENVMDFACDEISKICTCGVPILEETYCFANEDCLLQDATCKYLDSDLQLSYSSINCHQCQNMKFCFKTSATSPGTCACRSQMAQTKLASCQAENSNQLLSRMQFIALPVDDLCLFTPNSDIPNTAVSFRFLTLIPCFLTNPSAVKCLFVQDLSAHYIIAYENFASRRLLSSDENLQFLTRSPLCRDALASEVMPFTQKSCMQSYKNSIETLKLINFDTMLPACTFCSPEDFIHAAQQNPIAILNLIAHIPSVLQRHGLLKPVLEWAKLTQNFLKKTAEAIKIHVKANNMTKEQVLDLSELSENNEWLSAHHILAMDMLFKNVASVFANSNKNSSNQVPININVQDRVVRSTRHLLLFRDLFENVAASNIQSVDKIHDDFFRELNAVYNYNTISTESASDLLQSARMSKNTDDETPGLWASAEDQSKKPFKPLFENYDYAKYSKAANDCDELKTLWLILLHAVNGTKMGFKTISNERDKLQSKPAETLRDSWPTLRNSSNSFAILQKIDLERFNDDRIIQITAFGVDFVLDLFGLQIQTFYDMIYSVVMFGNGALECDLIAMNVCSKWNVTIFNSFIIIGIYFSVVYAAFSFFKLGIVVMFASPIFFVFMLMLSYGFTPGCIGLVPTCLVQDLHSALNSFLPFVMSVPKAFVISEETDKNCIEATKISANETELCSNLINNGFTSVVESREKLLYCISQQPYARKKCLKSCEDEEFNFKLASEVINWIVASIGNNAAEFYKTDVLLRIKPFSFTYLNIDELVDDLEWRVYVLSRGDSDLISAFNICTVLNIYKILPYLFFFLVVVSFFAFLILAIAGSFYPWLLFIASLFSSIFAANSDD